MATPPSKEKLLEVWRRSVDADYASRIENDPEGSFALIRGIASALEKSALAVERSQQAVFYLAHGSQSNSPASSEKFATLDVTVVRSAYRASPLVIAVGAIQVEVLDRTYRNRDRVIWYPFDDEPIKILTFVATVAGFAGNVPYPVNELGGLLLDRIAFSDQARDRTNINASITNPQRIRGTGKPDTFEANDVGLYIKLVNAVEVANVGRTLQILAFDDPGTEIPVGSGLFPKEVRVETLEYARIFAAKADDGGVFVTQTDGARDSTIDDMALMPIAPVVGDAYYFANTVPQAAFEGIELEVSTPGVGVYEITWEYYDGTSYVELPDVSDLTSGFRTGGRITWTIPLDWASDTVDGLAGFWVRARVSSFTSIVAQPRGKRAHLLDRNLLTLESDGLHWAIMAWGDLDTALVIQSATLPTGGRDDDLYVLGDERGVYQQTAETDASFSDRASKLADVVSPAAIRRAVNRALAEVNKRGLALDVLPNPAVAATPEGQAAAVKGSVTGSFYDEDFLDNYTGTVTPIKTTGGSLIGAHAEAVVVATANIDLSLAVLPGVVDDHTVAETEDILLVGQTVPSENGLYNFLIAGLPVRVASWGWPTGAPGVNAGAWITAVADGTAYAETRWHCTAPDGSDVIGVDALPHIQLTSATEAFPLDKWVLLLSEEEYRWHFFILLPRITLEDFGMNFDEGPVTILDSGEFLGPAYQGFLDGATVTADAIYASIYNSVDAIRTGGVGFTMILVDDL